METRATLALVGGVRGFPALAAGVLAFVTGGCAGAVDSARLDEVARAGIAYAAQVPRLLDRAFEVAAAVDSRALAEARGGLSDEQRRTALEEFDATLAARLDDYEAARRHNDLLKSYFAALRAMLASDGPAGAGAAARRLTAELGRLSPQLRRARMGDVSVTGLIEPASAMAVAWFRFEALRLELAARGAAIERELALQEALVTAVARQVRADREALAAGFRDDEVVAPYLSAARLPRTWPARRLKSLRKPADVEAAQAAAQAIRALRQAYVAAVAGRLDAGRAVELAASVGGFVELAARLGAEAGGMIR